MLAPRRASSRAQPRPIPREAPVTAGERGSALEFGRGEVDGVVGCVGEVEVLCLV